MADARGTGGFFSRCVVEICLVCCEALKCMKHKESVYAVTADLGDCIDANMEESSRFNLGIVLVQTALAWSGCNSTLCVWFMRRNSAHDTTACTVCADNML